MTRTRIVVPTTPPELSPPHFDDEATIITARPVVPIARAERSRLFFWMLPTVLAAAVFGALSALGVNYYENRHLSPVSPVTQLELKQEAPANPPPAEPQAGESPASEPAAVAASVAQEPTKPESGSSGPQTEPAIANQKEGLSASKDRAIGSNSKDPGAKSPVTAPSDQKTIKGSTDPGRLVRKRRVVPAAENIPPESRANKKNRGAGRILDIFEGPNHP